MDVENKRIACKIDMSDIVVALHKKAIERSKTNNYKIINSSISGEGEKAKYTSSGKNIISILPINNNIIIDKQECYEAIIKYITFFNGKDIASRISVDDLMPLVKEDQLAKDKKDKVDESSPMSMLVDVLFEAEDDQQKIANSNGQKIIGYYVTYDLEVGTQRASKNDDPWERLKKGIKSQLSDITVTFRGLWGQGNSHKLGNLMKDLDYKSIDATKLPSSVRQQIAVTYPELHADVSVIDTESLVNFLRNKIDQVEKKKLRDVEFALCIKITKRDKSYDLISKQEIADIVEKSITRHGFGNIVNPNSVSRDDIIYVNNYSDELKDQQQKYFKKNQSLHESQIIVANKIFSSLVGDGSKMLFEYSPLDLSAMVLKKINNTLNLFRQNGTLSSSDEIRPDFKENINNELNPASFDNKIKRVTKGEVITDVQNDTIKDLSGYFINYSNDTDRPMQAIGNIYSEVYDYREQLNRYDMSYGITGTISSILSDRISSMSSADISSIMSSNIMSCDISSIISSDYFPKLSGDLKDVFKYQEHDFKVIEKLYCIHKWYQDFILSLRDIDKDPDEDFIKQAYSDLAENNFKVTVDIKDKVRKLYDKLKSKNSLDDRKIKTIEMLVDKLKQYLNSQVITKLDLANLLEITIDYSRYKSTKAGGKSKKIEQDFINQKFAENNIDFNDFTRTLTSFIKNKYPDKQEQIKFLKNAISKINNIQKSKYDNSQAITDWDCYIAILKNLKFPDVEPDTRENSDSGK